MNLKELINRFKTAASGRLHKFVKPCCQCKKVVWPGQQSSISFSPIHLKCHQTMIDEARKDPALSVMMATEIRQFERETGLFSGIKA